MSERASGRIVSTETRIKNSEALKGRKLPESTKEKIRSYRHTEEAKLRIGLSNPRTRSATQGLLIYIRKILLLFLQ